MDRVEEAWRLVMGLEAGDGEVKFMDFEEREGMNNNDDDESGY